MKKKFTPEQRCLLILSVFNFSILLIFLITSSLTQLWGLTLGWGIGCLVTFLNMLLLFKTGDAITESSKRNSGLGISLAYYAFRFLIIGGALVACAVAQYVTPKDFVVFDWSVFTCAASVLPGSLILLIFYHEDEDKPTPTKK
ncbi:MAG: hypothetical protein MJ207_04040 [Bacilli bacterium]|nr:hypothetical protein [Bacilli bacterium]